MKTISQISKELEKINNALFTEESASELREMENDWEGYCTVDMGEMREVIEDRFDLAHSHRRKAGF